MSRNKKIDVNNMSFEDIKSLVCWADWQHSYELPQEDHSNGLSILVKLYNASIEYDTITDWLDDAEGADREYNKIIATLEVWAA